MTNCHQSEKALGIACYIFDPIGRSPTDDCLEEIRVWRWASFRDISAWNVLGTILNSLSANQPDERTNSWRVSPFLPHLIDRSRLVAYMK